MTEVSMQPPPSPHGIGAVCCMCGDRGLPHELLRCKLCRVRLQHRYCSDLYPRATAYRRCNWCLREPAAHAVSSSKPTEKRKAVTATSSSGEDGVRRQLHDAGCATTRSIRPAAEVGQPLKKQKTTDERAALPPSPGATAKGNNGNKKQKADARAELPPSPGATSKGFNGNKKHRTNERAELPPSPGATSKGNNGNMKQKADETAELPPSTGATSKGINGNKKHRANERAELPPSPGATSKGNNGNMKQKADGTAAQPSSPGAAKGNYGDKKPMQAGKLTRPGRVKVRRYKLLAEVISC